MTKYQQTISKSGHTRGGANYQTGALPLVPVLKGGASKAAGLLGSIGIGSAAGKGATALRTGGSAAAKAGASGGLTTAAGAGITGYTLGGITGGKLPPGLSNMDLGNLALGAGLLVGSSWLGIQGGFRLDTPLTPLSSAGMLAGGLLLYSNYASAQSKD